MNSQAEEKKAEEPVVIKIGGDELDLSKLPSLTIGHKRRMFKELGLDLNNLSKFNPEEEFQFVLFAVRLVRPNTTEQEMEALEIGAMANIIMGTAKATIDRAVDRPFSQPSPNSPGGGGGDQPT